MRARLLNGPTLFAAFFVVLFAGAIIVAFTYNVRARGAPLVISIPGLVLMLGWLATEIRTGGAATLRRKHDREVAISGEGQDSVSAPAKGKETSNIRKLPVPRALPELDPFLWVTGLLVLIWILGFQIAMPLFMFLYVKVRSREGWMLSIVLTVAAWAVAYFVFGHVLRIPLYEGIIAQQFLR